MASITFEQKCNNHSMVAAKFKCSDCGKFFCDACKVSYKDADYCTNCRKLTFHVMLTKIRNWRIPSVAALVLGAALGYGLFTGFVYAFATHIIGGYSDTVVALAILFVAASALLAGIAAGLLTREKIIWVAVFAGLLMLAVHIAVDFVYVYFELPIEGNATNVERVVSISYYAMLACILGAVGGLLASKIRNLGRWREQIDGVQVAGQPVGDASGEGGAAGPPDRRPQENRVERPR
jgi:MFS family permease